VHVDASAIALVEILTHLGESDIDHPIPFAIRNLPDSKHNYNATKREGLAMVYVLHKFRH
jgi:hypothetical protein